MENSNAGKTSVYVHIPFCEQICYYCDFAKVMMENQPVDAYLSALMQEIDLTKAQYPDKNFGTTYIGGGTPSALSAKQLDFLLAGLTARFPEAPQKEFSFEVNPGDLTAEKIAILKNYGVNRVSLGVQTFDDHLLKKIGRKHTAKDVYATLDLLEKNDLTDLSIDLIFALPGQTLAQLEQTLDEALALGLPHYALYSLILENQTMFMNLFRRGRLQLPDDDAAADMFELVQKKMSAAGREQYEISNFAKPGFESQHNLGYWNNEHYFGFGAGASGYLGHLRYKNRGPIKHYLAAVSQNTLPVVERENLTRANQMEEEMFLGLRKKSGVSIAHFEKKFGANFNDIYGAVTEKLIAEGLVVVENNVVRLTDKSLFVGNLVFEEYLLD